MADYSKLQVRVTTLHEERYHLIPDEENDCDVASGNSWMGTAYVNDQKLFDDWIDEHMSGATTNTRKFNGGSKENLNLIHFATKADAMLFKLTWYETEHLNYFDSCDSCSL